MGYIANRMLTGSCVTTTIPSLTYAHTRVCEYTHANTRTQRTQAGMQAHTDTYTHRHTVKIAHPQIITIIIIVYIYISSAPFSEYPKTLDKTRKTFSRGRETDQKG